jgi:hypothetical protein
LNERLDLNGRGLPAILYCLGSNPPNLGFIPIGRKTDSRGGPILLQGDVYNQQAFGDVQRLFVMQTGLDHVRLVGLYDYMTGANPVCCTKQKLLAESTVPLTS